MSGSEAILVLQRARSIAGEEGFRGSSAEALRKASVALDADHADAVRLLSLVRPPERMLQAIQAQLPRDRKSFRDRLVADFDAAIARLLDFVASRRKRVGMLAATRAFNWAGVDKETKEKRWTEIFPQVVEDVKKEIPK